MKKTNQAVRSNESFNPSGTSALEIDSLLSELSRLYLERFKVLRAGDHRDLQRVTDQIAAIKTKLNQL